MNRKASLPGASELFRHTGRSAAEESSTAGVASPIEPDSGGHRGAETTDHDGTDGQQSTVENRSPRAPGKRKHDSKITVYLSGAELLEMEQARLELRGAHDIAVDRGRIVREAVSVILDDFEEQGEDSVLVRRLRGVGDSPRENTN